MKAKLINETHIEGYLYEHALERKVSGEKSKNPGTEYIRGSISIATDDAMTNICSVFYSYVAPTSSSGKPNNTYAVLKNIVDGVYGTVMGDGADKAVKVRVDSALGLNEFYSTKDGKDELVVAKRNEGGFIHVTDSLNPDETTRNTFKVDMIITGVIHVDGNDETGTPDKAIVKGCIFDFRKNLLPVEFTATHPGAIAYYEGLDASASNPVFTQLWGRQISQVIVKQIRTESAFGDDFVREVKNTRKDFVITGSARNEYDWDDESTITADEFRKMIADREIHLATLKQDHEAYVASKTASAQPAAGGFNF